MILTFGNKATEDLFHGRRSPRVRKLPPDVRKVATRKLDMLNAAQVLNDLRIPPANRLEKLRGDFAGFYSIRINDQWRIIFKWTKGDALDVEVIDYH